jgi:peptidoglycan/LPS O-acetylase OafA/YrhL
MFSVPGNEPQRGTGRSSEIRALTGLRGLAALDVAFMHISDGKIWFLNFLAFHNQSVDIFFCLSGFTLSYAYQVGSSRRLNVAHFAVARFARVYPLFIAALLVAGIYSYLIDANGFSSYSSAGLWGEAIRQALMINAWPIVGTGAYWIDPMWSLSIEAFCYIAVFPILFALSWRLRKTGIATRLLAMLTLPFVAFVFYSRFYNPAVNGHHLIPVQGQMAHWVGIVRGVTMFTAGWIGYTIRADWPDRDTLPLYAVDAIGFSAVLVIIGASLGVLNIDALILLAPLFVMGIAKGQSRSAALLSNKLFYFLGRISYSLYILHWPVMVVSRYFLDRAGIAHGYLLAPMIISLLVAPLS